MDASTWNNLIASLPGAHVLQTWEWGQIKARLGWEPIPKVWQDAQGQTSAAALVLVRALPVPGLADRSQVFYVPRGPLLQDWADPGLRRQVIEDLHLLARQRKAIFIKIDPDVRLGSGVPGTPDAREDDVGQAVCADLHAYGWRFSEEQVQFRNTVVIDLRLSPEDLLARMKQKTRYNVRLAERRGVTIRQGTEADLVSLYRMYAETSLRDKFVIREEAYYRALWEIFIQAGMAEPLIAEVEGQPVAGLVIFRFAGKAWYMIGMSREAAREKMPSHLLQWEAMLRAKAAGCKLYDLWGAPDEFLESDPLWGVYRFKEGFGGKVVRGIGAWDLPVRPFYYRLYTQVLPRLLDWMRWRGRTRTQHSISRLNH
ncbi:MAG: hypothetical protein A2Z45_05400 [Chloroflexi bacterium RBG_19FT_COMBO_55_16]|nr:MAG: hypothetical protein A2Z45_05400 [Chloroflexi bacterium RBG_19FT_COMBO_55_16]